jgi:hypothetical protein
MSTSSKKVVMMTLVVLSLSTCAPALYAADEPQVTQEQVFAKPLVTDEQIRKDWPEVMRMVSRVNAQFDFQEKAQRVIRTTAGVIGIAFVVAVIVNAAAK